jgi:uncharacterized protein YyaL (SSP411 family)
VIEHFEEPETGFFFYTNKEQADVIVRKKEVYDGAVPSGNAVMAHNLLYLSIVFDKPEWRKERCDHGPLFIKSDIEISGIIWCMGACAATDHTRESMKLL